MALTELEKEAADLALRCAERDYIRIARQGPLEEIWVGRKWLVGMADRSVKAVKEAYRTRYGVTMPKKYLDNLVYEDARREQKTGN